MYSSSQENAYSIANYMEYNVDWDKVMSCLGRNGFMYRSQLRDEMCPNGTDEQRKAVFKQITYHATQFMRTIQARKAFINNHPKKLEIARKIIEARPSSKIITFSNNIKMAESIGMGGKVFSGRDSKRREEPLLRNLVKRVPEFFIPSVKQMRD